MGKYPPDGRRDCSDLTIKTWLANELAEANRLKIIELKILVGQDKEISGVVLQQFRLELNDQA